MQARRRLEDPVGLGEAQIPYDRSGMAGMEIPSPGGSMKKMSLEFTDAAEQQSQIPPGAGIPPAGMQQPPMMPAGMEPGPMPGMDQGQQQMPMIAGASMGEADSSMFSNADLAGLVDQDPDELAGTELNDALMGGAEGPALQQLQQRMMEAARRRVGF